jgi:hypothetical protein
LRFVNSLAFRYAFIAYASKTPWEAH